MRATSDARGPMSLPPTHRARASLVRKSRRSPRRRSRRGVSDVVATILILALTVTLFASIFAFVGSFPAPPPQNVNQFQASLVRTTNQTYLSGLTIEHLAGPAIPGSDRIYLESAHNEPNWQFSKSGGIPVYWGLAGNSSTSLWSFGQVWSTTFSKLIHVPDNITVYVLSSTELLYSVVLPGLVITTPPAILASGITPSTLSIGEGFEVWASLGGTLTGATEKVNLGSIPGLTGNFSMTLGSNGLWTYTSTSGSTTAGTYYADIYITNTEGFVASTSVPVVVSSSGGGGGSTQLTVTVGMSPNPPTLPQQSPTPYFWGTVTYTGSKTESLYLNFTISQIAGGRSQVVTATNTVPGTGSTPVSMTGPSSMTIYSQTASAFDNWLLNSSVTITAKAFLVGVGGATGSTAFATQNLVRGAVYLTTSTTGAYGSNVTTFATTCVLSGHGGTQCPYAYLSVHNTFSSGITFSGVVWANTTSGAVHDYELPATGVASTAAASGATTYVDLEQWSGMYGVAGGTPYLIHAWITLKSTAAGTPIVGYLSVVYHVTVT